METINISERRNKRKYEDSTLGEEKDTTKVMYHNNNDMYPHKKNMDALNSASTPSSSSSSQLPSLKINESCYSFPNISNNINDNSTESPSATNITTNSSSSPLAQTELNFHDIAVDTKKENHSFQYCDKMTSLSTPTTRNLIFNSPFQSRTHSPSSSSSNNDGSCNSSSKSNSCDSYSHPSPNSSQYGHNNNFFNINTSRSYSGNSIFPSPLNSSRSCSNRSSSINNSSDKKKINPFSTGPIFNPFVSYIDPCRYIDLSLSKIITAIIIYKRLAKKWCKSFHKSSKESKDTPAIVNEAVVISIVVNRIPSA